MKIITILIRHGTAEKNNRNEHGGAGTPLTYDGIREIEEAASKLLEAKIPVDNVYCVDRPQCIESASILSRIFNVRYIVLGKVEPYNLGVLDGLSEDQCKLLYPEINLKMELWRQGIIDITQLHIPGSTDPIKFVDSCSQVLKPILNDRAVIVGTRSVLVAFASILLGRHPVQGGGYVEIPWKNGAFIVFKEGEKDYIVDVDSSTNLIKI